MSLCGGFALHRRQGKLRIAWGADCPAICKEEADERRFPA
jgi:hypothetical protein